VFRVCDVAIFLIAANNEYFALRVGTTRPLLKLEVS